MKAIRSIVILVGLTLVFVVWRATRARAQAITAPAFTGTFTLPVQAQWGRMTLPSGEYTLYYGGLDGSGLYLLEVVGKATGSAHGMILAGERDSVKVAENVLDCVRENDTLYVRALELPAIGESIHFKIPHGVEVQSKVISGRQNQKGNNRVAQVATGIERVPVH